MLDFQAEGCRLEPKLWQVCLIDFYVVCAGGGKPDIYQRPGRDYHVCLGNHSLPTCRHRGSKQGCSRRKAVIHKQEHRLSRLSSLHTFYDTGVIGKFSVHMRVCVICAHSHIVLQVSKYFSEIFKKLAPDGHAVLVMKKGDTDQGVNKYLLFI